MITVNVQPTTSARSAVTYALLGTGKHRAQHVKDRTTRAALLSCTLDSPEEIVRRAEQVSAAFGRCNEMYCYTQNFSPEEFDVGNPEHVQRVHELGVKLAKRMNSADHLVVTHTDSSDGHLHNHIYIVNHDNLTGKALSRCRSWSRGLRQVNDELMRDEGCQVLPDPEQPKPDWDLRRGAFKDGGFEQVLAEHKVRLRVTERDGWTYSMRRVDNYKWAGARRRRSATSSRQRASRTSSPSTRTTTTRRSTSMSALDKLKEQQSVSETSAVLTSRLDAVEQQTKQLTEVVNSVNGFLKAMDEAQTAALKRLEKSTSQQHEPPSQTPPDAETKKRLAEIEKTLSAIAEQLSASGAIKLPDGEVVKRSDLDSYTMMTSLRSRLEATTTALAELTKTVGSGRTVRVDVNRLNDHAVKVLDDRLARAVEVPVSRIESTLDDFEQRVATIGHGQDG